MPEQISKWGKLALWWSAPALLVSVALLQIPIGLESYDPTCEVTKNNRGIVLLALPFIAVVALFIWRRKVISEWSVWLKLFLWLCALGSVVLLLVVDLALSFQGWGGCDGMGWP